MTMTKKTVDHKDEMNRTLSENIHKLEDINNFKSNMTNAIKEMSDI